MLIDERLSTKPPPHFYAHRRRPRLAYSTHTHTYIPKSTPLSWSPLGGSPETGIQQGKGGEKCVCVRVCVWTRLSPPPTISAHTTLSPPPVHPLPPPSPPPHPYSPPMPLCVCVRVVKLTAYPKTVWRMPFIENELFGNFLFMLSMLCILEIIGKPACATKEEEPRLDAREPLTYPKPGHRQERNALPASAANWTFHHQQPSSLSSLHSRHPYSSSVGLPTYCHPTLFSQSPSVIPE